MIILGSIILVKSMVIPSRSAAKCGLAGVFKA
jgi:hypothetical protein